MTKKYKVTTEFDGHKVGDVIELTDEQALEAGLKVEAAEEVVAD